MAAVTLAVVNGRLRTGDPRRPVADALAVGGGVLLAVGGSAEIRKLAGTAARVIDARGAMIVPVTPHGVLQRGAPASFRVAGPTEAGDLFRMVDGMIEADALA